MTTTAFAESEERQALRKAVRDLGRKYGRDYFNTAAAEGRKTTELWAEAGKLGYLGVAVPEEYGGGGGDIGDLAAVCEHPADQPERPRVAATGAVPITPIVHESLTSGSFDSLRRWHEDGVPIRPDSGLGGAEL